MAWSTGISWDTAGQIGGEFGAVMWGHVMWGP